MAKRPGERPLLANKNLPGRIGRALSVRAKNLPGRIGRVYMGAQNIASNLLEDVPVIFENYSKKPEDRLFILDDIFPHVSGFRVAEYNVYLERFASAEVHSTASSTHNTGGKRSFQEMLDEYERRYPQFRNRVFKFNPRRSLKGKLTYTIFLNNAGFFIDIIEKYKIPFVFTLYPGGGFHLKQDVSDNKLRRVCSSPSLRKVIATQKISYEYLIDENFCEPEKVEFIYGGVPSENSRGSAMTRKYYKQDKDTFDICFVAYKYMERGIDKGYDVFVEVAKLLSNTHKDVFFHVVGPFDESDIDVSDIKSKITFYGMRHTEFFPEFYSRIDIILAPNVPFVLMPGAFDGAPNMSCVEAGLHGVAVLFTDILGQNIFFKDGEEVVVIPRDIEEICGIIERYYNNYDDLCELGKRGQAAFSRVFAIETQMRPRLQILSEFMV